MGTAALLVGAGCATDPDNPCGTEASLAGSRPVTAQVSLAPGGFQLIQDSAATGAVLFPAAGANGAAYVVVGQLATSQSGNCSTFALGGQAFPADLRAEEGGRANTAQRFHAMLRTREGEYARQASLHRDVLRTAPVARTPPPVTGSKRSFKVCANIDCEQLRSVTATAQWVGGHAAIFVDDSAPSGGFTQADLTQIGNQFDQVIYPIDTTRFGAESDIDGNGRIIVLLSPRINALVPFPQCNESFITGYFFGADIAPGTATQYNNGEIFYGMVPDPIGATSNCPYSTSFVKRILPTTFIHEFQHMISYNQRVLVRGGLDEELWLNEALSHLAEELGGLHYDSLDIDSTAQRFHLGNLYNAFTWMSNPSENALVTNEPPGTLEERGAGWLLVRYLVDQYGPATTRALTHTTLTGAANISAAAGNTPFRTVLARWALAVYLNGLPGYSPPTPLSFSYWNFRATFAGLHAARPSEFPVADPFRPDSGFGGALASSGTIRAGSAAYVVATQLPSSSGFQLVFRGPHGGVISPAGVPQLAVARIR